MPCTPATPCCAPCCAGSGAISRVTGSCWRRSRAMNDSLKRPVVLDLDGSVGALPDRLVLPLAHWQESLRFGCSLAAMRRFGAVLDGLLPAECGTVFLGSGDFHHLSWPLIARLRTEPPFQVVVLDNHPDNMRFPFGVHCGSWVRKVALLAQVSHVHVLGITSADIGAARAWENYLAPLRRRKLTYWSVGVDIGWSRRLGLSHAFRGFDSAAALVDAFVESQRTQSLPSYLSIDKDVFAPEVAQTNWDQGCLLVPHALALIDPAMLADWHAQQHALNLRLLEAITAKGRADRSPSPA